MWKVFAEVHRTQDLLDGAGVVCVSVVIYWQIYNQEDCLPELKHRFKMRNRHRLKATRHDRCRACIGDDEFGRVGSMVDGCGCAGWCKEVALQAYCRS